MTQEVKWQDVTLLDLTGKPIGRATVPKAPMLPGIVMWSNRYFRLLMVNDTYLETSCYLVPIEKMYSNAYCWRSLGKPKAKK